MNFRERNLKNVISRWKRQHEKELSWIKSHSNTDIFRARICGYLAGDGGVSIRKETTGKVHNEIRFFPDHESLIEPYLEAFEKAYNKVPKTLKKKNFYEIRINSKIIVYDLLKLCTFGLNSWTIPIFSNPKCKIEWLRSMFDSDAYVGKNGIRLKTVNKRGLESVKKLLHEFDIETSIIYAYSSKNKKWNTNYILDIRKIESVKKFSQLIGFNHKLKQERLLKLIE